MKKLLTLIIVYPLAALLSLRLGAVLAGLPTIAAFFSGVHPVLVVATLATGFALTSYLLGVVTNDFSWVDRLWSTAPIAFAWVYAVRSGIRPSVVLAALLVTVWGLRLTYNFARRGGYTTMEDYRWPILRERINNPVLWQLFNLLFISSYQIGLFILFTLPVHRLSTLPGLVSPVTMLVAAALFLAFLVYETVADQQQWTFQNLKHGAERPGDLPRFFGDDRGARRENLDSDIARGFLTHGLFRYSRHPNYFGELMVWWTLFIYGVAAGGGLIDVAGLGVVLLTLLFVGSTRFTESITASRYPEYSRYQATTSAIVPWAPGSPEPQEQVE